MSFSLGGDGPFLPPRKKKDSDSSDLGAQRPGVGRGGRPPGGGPSVSGPRSDSPIVGAGSSGGVQQSTPAFKEPGIKVDASKTGVTLPMGTSSNVVSIADRTRNRTFQQAAQSAIAKSGGIGIPAANISNGAMRPAIRNGKTGSGRGARPQQPRTPERSMFAQSSDEVLCRIVFIIQAAKYGQTLTVGKQTYSVEQVKAAAEKATPVLAAALKSGKYTREQVAACIEAYCKAFACPVEEKAQEPTPQPPPPPASGQEPVPTQPQPLPYVPPSGGGGGGGGGGSAIMPVAPTPFPGEVAPVQPGQPMPMVAAPKKSNTLWWLLALGATALLVKKLAAVKVVGAAVAGVPLIAEMTDEDEPESESDEPEEVEGEEPVETESPQGED